MPIKSVLPIIALTLLAAAESHPLRRSAETNLTSQNGMPFNLDTMPSTANIGNEYLPSTRLKKRLGEEESNRHNNEMPVPITVKLNKKRGTYLWTGKVTLVRGPMPVAGPQSFEVGFRTALSNFNLFSSAPKGSKDLKLYEPLKNEQEVKELSEKTGRRVYNDAVEISGVQLKNIHIVSLSPAVAIPESYLGDGSIGMSFATKPELSQLQFFRSLMLQYPHHSNVFAFYFSWDYAELHLGGIKKDFFIGGIEYYSIIAINGDLPLDWVTGSASILINHHDHRIIMSRCLIDTGSEMVHGPRISVVQFYEKIGGSEKTIGDKEYFTIPCGNNQRIPAIGIKWGSGTRYWDYEHFSMPSQQHGVCIGGIQVQPYPFVQGLWSIGTRFLIDKYPIFDLENKMFGLAVGNSVLALRRAGHI